MELNSNKFSVQDGQRLSEPFLDERYISHTAFNFDQLDGEKNNVRVITTVGQI